MSKHLLCATPAVVVNECSRPFPDLAASSRAFQEGKDGVQLLGSVSMSSGAATFPARRVCPKTGAQDMVPFAFGPFGKLYSFSTVHVSATRQTPYTIGYVDFECGVRVLAEIEGDPSGFGCDRPVEVRVSGDRWFVVCVPTLTGASA